MPFIYLFKEQQPKTQILFAKKLLVDLHPYGLLRINFESWQGGIRTHDGETSHRVNSPDRSATTATYQFF